MFEASHLVPLARVAEDVGFDSITLPDSVFFPEKVSGDYPYTPDGSRFWAPETPYVDPFIGIPAMAAATDRIRFYTNVVKLPIRDPLLVAKQVASIASLSADRFALGVGLSWMPEEFEWTKTEKSTRGVRTDEMIEIIRAVCPGGGPAWAEFHGKHYEFERLMISPAPEKPVPIYIGGHSEPSLKRAARLGDGWISVNVTTAEIADAITLLKKFLNEQERSLDGFVISVLATDAFDLDGYRRLADLGVTHVQAVPWYFYGGNPDSLDVRRNSLEKYAQEIIAKF